MKTIFEIFNKYDGLVYEIRGQLPDSVLARYTMDIYLSLGKNIDLAKIDIGTLKPEVAKQLEDLDKQIISHCADGWRIQGEEKWRTDFNKDLPLIVRNSFIDAIQKFSREKLEVRVKQEKN